MMNYQVQSNKNKKVRNQKVNPVFIIKQKAMKKLKS